MRAVIQRVTSASVTVDGEVIGAIGRGLCVLIGLSRDDQEKDLEWMVRKLLNVRVFENGEGKRWQCSLAEMKLEILCISQFTLHASLKGNKLDFHHSMGAEMAPKIYEQFLDLLKKEYDPNLVKDGKFGAYMKVNIENDGPVTITLDSTKKDVD